MLRYLGLKNQKIKWTEVQNIRVREDQKEKKAVQKLQRNCKESVKKPQRNRKETGKTPQRKYQVD